MRIKMMSTFVALILFTQSLSADDFVITVTNLDGSPITNTSEVSVQAFKQEAGVVGELGINFSVGLRRGQLEIPIVPTPTTPSVVGGSLVFRFAISSTNPILTENGTDRDKVVVLVFFRNGRQIAAIPSLVMTNTTHVLSIAAPRASGYRETKRDDCSPKCESNESRGIIRRLFRRCR